MPVASKDAVDLAEKMLSGDIEHLKLRVDRIEKIIASLEGNEEEEEEEEEEEVEEEEERQREPLVLLAPAIPDNIQGQ
jgi:hypothetical protein